jgi:transposase InsO family protein
MPWKAQTPMSQRQAFIERAMDDGVNMSQLCREFGISRKTGYKWLERYHQAGADGLAEQSRRPHHSPNQTAPQLESLIVAARQQHPTWGARKLHAWLTQQGHLNLPVASTITAILQRHDLLNPDESLKHRPYQRFEREQANQLWQMDFKGEFDLATQQTCYPLTILDDHSRFALGLFACPNTAGITIKPHLISVFTTYGLPEAFLMDHGAPWGNGHAPYTQFSVWLMRLGIQVLHGRAYHPQTQGKIERFHRTLKSDLLQQHDWLDFGQCQQDFNQWRQLYNTQRPHEALDQQPPFTRFVNSPRPYPQHLPEIQYADGTLTRKVNAQGRISFQGRLCPVGGAFSGLSVAVHPNQRTDGLFDVYFARTRIAKLDFNSIKYPLS